MQSPGQALFQVVDQASGLVVQRCESRVQRLPDHVGQVFPGKLGLYLDSLDLMIPVRQESRTCFVRRCIDELLHMLIQERFNALHLPGQLLIEAVLHFLLHGNKSLLGIAPVLADALIEHVF